MIKRKNRLLIEQLDSKMSSLQPSSNIAIPSGGWINAIRTALNMSLQQLANRLGITAPSVKELEQREAEGSITIKKLRVVAQAMNMKLVYGFLPNDGSLKALIDKRAHELAREIVLRTSQNMKLEDQENSMQRLQKAIEERAEELKNDQLKLLWN